MEKIKQFLLKLSKRERLILFVAGVVFFGLLVDRLIYRPITHRFEKLDQEIQEQERQLRKNLRYVAVHERIMEEHEKHTAALSSAGSDEEETASLLNELEEITRKSGLSIINMKPRSSTTLDFVKKYAVEIEIRGEIVDLVEFLHELYSSEHLLNSEQIRLSGERTGSMVVGYLSITKTILL